MSKKNSNINGSNINTTAKQPVAPKADSDFDARVKASVEALLASDWEIPDSCIEGKYARKIETLEAQIKSLTARLLELSSKVEGDKAPVSAGRVDAVAAVKNAKKN